MALDLLSMFLLGVLGTGHCVGMCGPIVLVLPGGHRLGVQLAYHAGRVVTYVAIGAVLAGIGGGLTDVTRVQLIASLVAAAFLLAFGLARLGVLREPRVLTGLTPSRLPGFGRVMRALKAGQRAAIVPYGLLMGLLPCGLSYAAFARALAADGPAEGAALVLAFALGTVPGLLAVATAAAGLFRRHQQLSQLLAGAVMVAMAASLVVDGLGALL